MNAAFRLAGAGPTTGSLVEFTRLHGPRAGTATDTRITDIVKRIERQVVVEQVVPDPLAAPAQHRIDLDQAVGRVPLEDAGLGTHGGLARTDPGDPCSLVAEELSQWRDLAQVATKPDVSGPELVAVVVRLLFQRLSRLDTRELETQASLELVAERVGLGKQQIGIEVKDGNNPIAGVT